MAGRTLTAIFCILLLSVLMPNRAAAQERRLDAEQIKAGLRTTTVEENGFVDRVVLLVENGFLPARTVYTTFLWARKKPKHKFQYFRRAMIIRARELGIRL
jgi:hypothetical protein